MNKVVKILICLACLLLLPLTAHAQDGQTTDELYREQLEASGAEELFDDIPDETRRLLEEWGVTDLSPEGLTALDPAGLMNAFLSLLAGQAGGPVRSMTVLLGVVLLFALMEGTRQTVGEESLSKVFGVVCGLVACAALLVPLSGCIGRVRDASESAAVFMASYVPVYAGVLVASGQVATAASFQTVVLFAAELVTLLATTLLVPLMTVSLALGLTGSVAPEYKLGAAGNMINQACGWLLGLGTTLFIGLLSIQGIVAGAADSLTGRAVKFSVSSFVPVVGGTLSEALGTVQGCLTLLKSTLGGVGILVTALIVLPPLLECALWLFVLSFTGMAAEMFGLSSLSALFKTAQGVLRLLVGVLAACGVFMIVATTIVTKTAAV